MLGSHDGHSSYVHAAHLATGHGKVPKLAPFCVET